jgi:hypothetical protein
MDAKVMQEARRAALDAATDANKTVYGEAWLVRSTIDAAIDAYEAALKAAGYEIAETVESMTGRALMMAAQNDEHEKRFRERYAVVPREPTEAMIDAGAQAPDMGATHRETAAVYRAMIAAAANPAP